MTAAVRAGRCAVAVTLLLGALPLAALGTSEPRPPSAESETGAPPPSGSTLARSEAGDARSLERSAMVERLTGQGIHDPKVIEAMRRVPRHLFVPPEAAPRAYDDWPLAIGFGQTISAPFIVAYMTQLLELREGMKVLEIGTGSGYQASIVAAVIGQVFSIEIVPELARSARERLERLGFDRVRVREGDGYFGWPEEAPFDAMIVTAAADHIPPPLVSQLADGGRMVIPVGASWSSQTLMLVTRRGGGAVERKALLPVIFVPMTGRVQRSD